MNDNIQIHSAAWKNFTLASFVISLGMTGGGILFLPIDLWMKGYLGMGRAHDRADLRDLTKTQRDIHEASQARQPHRGRPHRAPADGSRQDFVNASQGAVPLDGAARS